MNILTEKVKFRRKIATINEHSNLDAHLSLRI